MKFYLYRQTIQSISTDGVLQDAQGIRICETAEQTRHMLPEGTYQLTIRRHKQYGHRVPTLLPLTAASTTSAASTTGARGVRGCMLHGNGVLGKNIGATILLGDNLVPGVVIHSQPHFKRLLKRLEKLGNRGIKVELVIQQA